MESQSRQTLTVDESTANERPALGPTETTFGQLLAEPRRNVRIKYRIDGVVAWLITSVAFLGYLAFGSFSVQVWRYSDYLQQYFPIQVERRILHIWIYQGNQLPHVRYPWMLHSAYYACLFVCIAAAIYGLWLLLDRAGTGAPRQPAERRRPQNEA